MAGRQPGAPTPLEQALIDEIKAQGPLGYDQVVERALYDPDHGFFATGGRAGGGGDFLTSPEVGPLFGAVLARALDGWWTQLGEPERFDVVEAGAGVGSLARAVLAAEPACGPALHYVLVERADVLRSRHGDHLPLAGRPQTGTGGPPGTGPWVESVAELPAGPRRGVILANELLDNLAFGLLERDPSGWSEVRVDVQDEVGEVGEVGGRAGLVESRAEAPAEVVALADQLAPDAAPGARIPDQAQARAWVADVLGRLERGWLVVIDYADTTASMAGRPMSDWVRTYHGHRRGGAPLRDLGLQDITCEVATDQLAMVRPADRVETQAGFLERHGLAELVEQGRQEWTRRAHIGDLAAIRARSRVGEGEALSDPAGLGGFTVLQWHQA